MNLEAFIVNLLVMATSPPSSHPPSQMTTSNYFYFNISIEILDRLWDFVNDEPEGNDEEDGEGEPLAVKR